MLTRLDKVMFTVMVLLFAGLIIFRKDVSQVFKGNSQASMVAAETDPSKSRSGKGKDNKDKAGSESLVSGVVVTQEWKIPEELSEISAIAYLDENRFVCLQDEEGTLYIFNTEQGTIDKKIPFGAAGDYEGITIRNKTVYVVNSSGVIFEIQDFMGQKPVVQTFRTPLTAKNDVEGIGWDEAGNRLLVTVKEDGVKDKKGIYVFDLATKTMDEQPGLQLNFNDRTFREAEKKGRGISPSSLEIHPGTRDIYILEGTHPKLLLLDQQGAPQRLLMLDKKDFPQPEGLTFDNKGNLYISNEGKKGKANIMKVRLP